MKSPFPGMDPYLEARWSDVHAKLIGFIGLLRYPPRGRLGVSEADIPLARRAPYMVWVRRGWTPEESPAYPVSLRHPLPQIPIPLRRTDAEIGLDLQPLIDRVYISGGHDDIDYRRAADPPLDPPDAAWADELLQAAGKR